MKHLALALFLAACSSSSRTPTTVENRDPEPVGTELERRRDAACESLAPRLTECAIADARATMSAEEFAKLDIEKTAPIHTEKFLEACKGQAMSSRQVRVYEVCQREERECEPLIACLDNANPQTP